MANQIAELHAWYEQATGQKLRLAFDRERLWYEFLKGGFTLADLKRVVTYLQKEIRESRRNVGSLKISNLLQLDKFEEDLNISRVQLYRPTATEKALANPTTPKPVDPEKEAAAVEEFKRKKKELFGR